MKKIFALALIAGIATSSFAQDHKAAEKKPAAPKVEKAKAGQEASKETQLAAPKAEHKAHHATAEKKAEAPAKK